MRRFFEEETEGLILQEIAEKLKEKCQKNQVVAKILQNSSSPSNPYPQRVSGWQFRFSITPSPKTFMVWTPLIVYA
jgi:hypothetical protein